MSIVMQSSSAAAATTLVALHAGSLTFDQACAMIVGQSVGTAATSALVAIGAGLAVRRAALAHIVYNVSVGLIGLLLLGPMVAAAGWVGARLDDPQGVLALAAFSSIFKLIGVMAFFPWLDRYSQLIVTLSGRGSETAVSRLDPVLARAGGGVAVEAAWRATLEIALGSIDAVRRGLAGERPQMGSNRDAVRQVEHFLESLSLETTDLGSFEPRLVRLSHALDHLTQLGDDLARTPPVVAGWEPPPAFAAGGRALAAWLDAAREPKTSDDPAILKAVEQASRQLNEESRAAREKILQDLALQRTRTEGARAALDALAWASAALYHAWRTIVSLKIAADADEAVVDDVGLATENRQ